MVAGGLDPGEAEEVQEDGGEEEEEDITTALVQTTVGERCCTFVSSEFDF